jgi:hypothetical protein
MLGSTKIIRKISIGSDYKNEAMPKLCIML